MLRKARLGLSRFELFRQGSLECPELVEYLRGQFEDGTDWEEYQDFLRCHPVQIVKIDTRDRRTARQNKQSNLEKYIAQYQASLVYFEDDADIAANEANGGNSLDILQFEAGNCENFLDFLTQAGQ